MADQPPAQARVSPVRARCGALTVAVGALLLAGCGAPAASGTAEPDVLPGASSIAPTEPSTEASSLPSAPSQPTVEPTLEPTAPTAEPSLTPPPSVGPCPGLGAGEDYRALVEAELAAVDPIPPAPTTDPAAPAAPPAQASTVSARITFVAGGEVVGSACGYGFGLSSYTPAGAAPDGAPQLVVLDHDEGVLTPGAGALVLTVQTSCPGQVVLYVGTEVPPGPPSEVDERVLARRPTDAACPPTPTVVPPATPSAEPAPPTPPTPPPPPPVDEVAGGAVTVRAEPGRPGDLRTATGTRSTRPTAQVPRRSPGGAPASVVAAPPAAAVTVPPAATVGTPTTAPAAATSLPGTTLTGSTLPGESSGASQQDGPGEDTVAALPPSTAGAAAPGDLDLDLELDLGWPVWAVVAGALALAAAGTALLAVRGGGGRHTL